MNVGRTKNAGDGDHELGRHALVCLHRGWRGERRHVLVGEEDDDESGATVPGGDERVAGGEGAGGVVDG